MSRIPLPTTESVRIPAHILRSQADRFKQFDDPILECRAFFGTIDTHRFPDNICHCHAWVERSVWVLEDHLDPSPKRTHLAVCQFCEVYLFISESEASACRWNEAEDAPSGSSLSTATFADESEGFAALDIETDPVYGFHVADGALKDPFLYREVFSEVIYLKQFCHFF